MQVTWEMLEDAVSDCRGCVLCQTRQHTVLGEGSRNADVMFVGEGPGQQEDEQGRPFVGPGGAAAGQNAGCHRAGPQRGLHRQHRQVPPAA